MKVINLGKRIIFTDDIQYIYNEERCGEYHDYTEYYIVTKVGKFNVDKYEYDKVKEYLLSLNEDIPKEDKKIEQIGKSYDIEKYQPEDDTYIYDMRKLIEMVQDIYNKQSEIIDMINGE